MLLLSARRVPGAGLTFAFVMVGERDVNSKGAGRVLRVAQISARLMVEGRNARGATLVRSLAKMIWRATCLLEVKLDSVGRMVPWFRIEGFTVVQLLVSMARIV